MNMKKIVLPHNKLSVYIHCLKITKNASLITAKGDTFENALLQGKGEQCTYWLNGRVDGLPLRLENESPIVLAPMEQLPEFLELLLPTGDEYEMGPICRPKLSNASNFSRT